MWSCSLRQSSRRESDRRGLFESDGTAHEGDGFRVELEPASDDQSPEADVWFEIFTAAEPDLPRTAMVAGDVWLGNATCARTLDVGDAETLEVTFVPVDAAGNRGEPFTETLGASSSCAAAGAGLAGWMGLLLPALVLKRRRRGSGPVK